MAEEHQGLLLADLSWPEIRDIRDQVELVLLPVGSNEQHGPNLAVNMDIASCAEFCRRASAMMHPRVAVAPAMPWGVSFHHMNFPGTITLSTETFIQVLVEVIASLQHHGFERFLIVNGHGGNIPAMNVAAVRAAEELQVSFVGACSYFSFSDRSIAQNMSSRRSPGTPAKSRRRARWNWCRKSSNTIRWPPVKSPICRRDSINGQALQRQHPVSLRRLTRNGALGDARDASPQFGREMIQSGLANFTQFCDELISANPSSHLESAPRVDRRIPDALRLSP